MGIAYLAGAWLDSVVKVPSWAPPSAGIALLLLAYGLRRRRGLAGTLPLLLLIGATGFARHHLAGPAGSGTIRGLCAPGERVPVRVIGLVASPVHRLARETPFGPGYPVTRFGLALLLLEGRGVRLREPARLRVTVLDRLGALRFGDRVQVRGHLRRPAPPTNPGERDFATYLWIRGVEGTLSSPHRRNVNILARNQGPTILTGIHRAREAALSLFADWLGDEAAALVSCMLLGEREGISPEMRRNFEWSGTLHVLAISGLHVTLIASFLWLLLRGLGFPRRRATVAILTFLVFYAILTDLRPSVIRSALMIAIFLGGEIVGRRSDPCHSLAAAAILTVTLFPRDLHSPGFHLSYLSVLSIVLLSGPIASLLGPEPGGVAAIPGVGVADRLRRTLGRSLRRAMSISLAAWLGSAPLVLHLFHIVTPITVVSNLIVLPLVGLLLGSALLLATLVPVAPLAGIVLGPVTETLARGVLAATGILADVPGSHLYLPSIPPSLGVLYCTVLALLFRSRLPPWLPPVRLLLWALGAFLVVVAAPLRPSPPRLAATFLDVGLGGASIVRLPGGATVLYDCGADRGIAPALWAEGVCRVDAVFLSHSHRDHLSGLPSLLEIFPVGTIIVPPDFLRSGNGRTVAELARGHAVPIQVAARGDRIGGLGEGVTVEVLGPPRDLPSRLSPNDGSLVVRIRALGKGILLPGDIETAGTALLLLGEQELQAEVIVVPHHGAANPLSGRLARAVSPRLAVLSTRIGFTDPAVLEAYREGGARIISTAEVGAVRVTFRSDGTPDLRLGR